MEHKPVNTFGSLAGDDSEIFLTLRDDDENKSHSIEHAKRDSIAKTLKSSRSTLANDFSILSLNDVQEYDMSSNRDTDSNIQASSIKSASNKCESKDNDEIIEVEVNESCSNSEDQQKFNPLFLKLLIIGLKKSKIALFYAVTLV